MPATAISHGDGRYGIEADETGIVLSNITYNFTNDRIEHKDRNGIVSGITYKNERCEIELTGTLPKTASFSGTLAATIALQNTIPTHLQGGVTGGAILVEEVNLSKESEGYQGLTIKAVLYPNVSPTGP